jgi:hypothetical protein
MPRMRLTLYVLAAMAVTGCGQDLDTHPMREAEYGHVSAYGYTPGDPSGRYASKWNYYRNYRGRLHPGPESYP